MTTTTTYTETDLTVRTTRFGDLAVAPDAVVTFTDGLLGFPDARRFVAVPHDAAGSPFVYLQSVERAELAFLLLPPALVSPGYAPPLPADVDSGQAALWAIVTVPPGRPRDMTVNLLGPLAIMGSVGRQIVLDNPDGRYAARHPVAAPAQPAAAAA